MPGTPARSATPSPAHRGRPPRLRLHRGGPPTRAGGRRAWLGPRRWGMRWRPRSWEWQPKWAGGVSCRCAFRVIRLGWSAHGLAGYAACGEQADHGDHREDGERGAQTGDAGLLVDVQRRGGDVRWYPGLGERGLELGVGHERHAGGQLDAGLGLQLWGDRRVSL